MIGQYNEITMNDILTAVKMNLRLANTTEHDDFLEMTAREALRHIGALTLFKKKQTCLEVCDGQLNVQMPKDFYRLLGARTSKNGRCDTMIYLDKKFLSDSGCTTTSEGIASLNEGFQMNGGFLHFNSDMDVDEIEIAYLAFNTDKFGNIKIYEHYERAIKEYCLYTFKLAYKENYEIDSIERHYKIWKNQKAWIKGVDANIDFLNQKREIQELFLSLIAGRNNNL